MKELIGFLGNNISFVIGGIWVASCPFIVIYKLKGTRKSIVRFPTTEKYDLKFQMYKDRQKARTQYSSKGFK